jgi:Fe2+ transport system protein B
MPSTESWDTRTTSPASNSSTPAEEKPTAEAEIEPVSLPMFIGFVIGCVLIFLMFIGWKKITNRISAPLHTFKQNVSDGVDEISTPAFYIGLLTIGIIWIAYAQG